MPIPNISSPYDPLPHSPTDPNPHDTDDDTPEITINAATQIRGHGNIISIAQMDSIRIANLISSVLSSADSTSPVSPKPEESEDNTPPTPISPSPTTASRQYTSTTRVRGIKRYPNINITVHCGATIIGDRNIVGPGLGDIARQMQIAQRNQAAMVAQQRAAAAAAAATTTSQGYTVGQGQCQQQQQQGNGGQGQGQMGVVTPPMSRSCSLDGGVGERKRKGVEGVESGAQRRRC